MGNSLFCDDDCCKDSPIHGGDEDDRPMVRSRSRSSSVTESSSSLRKRASASGSGSTGDLDPFKDEEFARSLAKISEMLHPECRKRYRLLSPYPIGSGTTSKVYEATSVHDDKRMLAAKIIDKRKLSLHYKTQIDVILSQLKKEIEVLRGVQHSQIVDFHEYFESRDSITMIMERCEGDDLFEFVVSNGPLLEETALDIAYQLLSVISYLHERGVIHRDIKAENVIINRKNSTVLNAASTTSSSNMTTTTTTPTLTTTMTNAMSTISTPPLFYDIKLIDFGFSTVLGHDLTGTFLGTGGYLAPEIRQQRHYSKAVDVWAAGVLLYFIVSTQLPFTTAVDSLPQDLHSCKDRLVLLFPEKKWSHVSEDYKTLIKKMLELNPLKRITAAEALQEGCLRRFATQTSPFHNLHVHPFNAKNLHGISNQARHRNNSSPEPRHGGATAAGVGGMKSSSSSRSRSSSTTTSPSRRGSSSYTDRSESPSLLTNHGSSDDGASESTGQRVTTTTTTTTADDDNTSTNTSTITATGFSDMDNMMLNDMNNIKSVKGNPSKKHTEEGYKIDTTSRGQHAHSKRKDKTSELGPHKMTHPHLLKPMVSPLRPSLSLTCISNNDRKKVALNFFNVSFPDIPTSCSISDIDSSLYTYTFSPDSGSTSTEDDGGHQGSSLGSNEGLFMEQNFNDELVQEKIKDAKH